MLTCAPGALPPWTQFLTIENLKTKLSRPSDKE